MPLTAEEQNNITSLCKQGNYTEAADLLVGDAKEEHSHEEIINALESIGSTATPGVISSIYNAYNESSSNIPILAERLANIASNHTINKITTTEPKTTSTATIDLENANLEKAITDLRFKQQEYIQKNGTPNDKIADQLTELINRQQASQQGANLQKRALNNDPKDPEAKHWFVQPKASELEKYESVKVVTGSPVRDVLQDRYESQYNTRISDPKKTKKSMTPEEQFVLRKENDRQTSFVNNYKDPNNIEDRDIFVHQVASKFTTDSYKSLSPQQDPIDRNIKYYNFPSGRLIDRYDDALKTHKLEIEGEIPGTFSLCIKRRTESGRIIDDAYDIVEFRNGSPSFYTSSAKGALSIKYIDEIRRPVAQTTTNLEHSTPATLQSSDPAKNKETPENDLSQNITPLAEASQGQESGPLKTTLEEVMTAKAEENLEQTQSSEIPEQQTESQSQAAYFRSQLSTALTKETSATTINYLAKQLAQEENKPLDEILEEFKLPTSQASQESNKENLNQPNTPKQSPTQISTTDTNSVMKPPKSPELEKIKQELVGAFNNKTNKITAQPSIIKINQNNELRSR